MGNYEREIFNGDYAQVSECVKASEFERIYLIEQTPSENFQTFHFFTSRTVCIDSPGSLMNYEIYPSLSASPPLPDDPLTWRFDVTAPKIFLQFSVPNTRWGVLLARSMAISISVGILPFTPLHLSLENLQQTQNYWKKQVQTYIDSVYDKMINKGQAGAEH